MLSVARDITLSKKLRESQSYLSVRDSVTNLLNAAAFRVVVDCWIALAERNQQGFILVFIGLEDIETEVISHGPDAAEAILQIVADSLRASFRKSDVIARVRPDKFAVLALYAIESDAPILENRVKANLDQLLAARPDVPRPRLRVTAAFYDPAMPPSLDALFASVALAHSS